MGRSKGHASWLWLVVFDPNFFVAEKPLPPTRTCIVVNFHTLLSLFGQFKWLVYWFVVQNSFFREIQRENLKISCRRKGIVIRETLTWNMTRIFYFTWVKPACCVSKISSDGGCQSKETDVNMEVRLLSVGARGFFLAASWLAFVGFAAQFCRPPTRKKPLAPRVAANKPRYHSSSKLSSYRSRCLCNTWIG